MPIPEISDYIESYSKMERHRQKETLCLFHFLARDIANHVSLIFSDNKEARAPELWDYYPELFQEEKLEADKRQMEVYQAQMRDFAYRHNEKK